ncbi:MAG TPA: hypothetical protein VLE97_08765 [Gaiellaceae bacterium]|nr:hypothetical protein [Gaiellaceae bacterium]
MSRDVILTDESDVRYSFSNIKTQGWLNGHTSGLDAAVGWLKERAVKLFRDGKDDAATNLRKLADQMDRELRPDMEARAKRHEKEFPAVIEGE